VVRTFCAEYRGFSSRQGAQPTARSLSGASTKRQVVDDALRLLVRIKRQEGLRSLRGKVQWDGDLERMRRDR
jgi:Arc/MetJ family transcription regulator